LAAVASRARAETTEPSLTGPPTDPLPFTNTELERALLARLLTPPDATGALRTQVEPAGQDAVRVQVGARSRVVALAGRTGAAAARVVALVMAELVSAAPDISATAAPVPADSPPHAAPLPNASNPPASPVLSRRRAAAPRLCITGGVAKGIGEDLLAGTLDVDLVVPIGSSRLRIAPSVGLAMTPTRNAGTFDEVSFLGASIRLLGGAAIGPADLLAGPVLSPYSIRGATAHDGLLIGGEAMARVAAPLATRLWLVAAARVDGYAERVRVHWPDGRAYATPRVNVAVDVGLAWSWAS
jgi:hypothetical protein